MKYMKLMLMMVSLFFGAGMVDNLDAKGYSSSGSRSSFSSSSRSSYSTPKSTYRPAPAAKPQAAKPKDAYGSSHQTSTRPVSKVDAKRYESAAKEGKVFTTREAAVKSFNTPTNTAKYTSKYTAEPKVRPAHVPTSTNVGGTPRDVVYNQGGGGYGYYSGSGPGLGTFIMYDMMSDAIMMNQMMARDNYYVGNPPVVNQPQYQIENRRSNGGAIAITILGAFVFIVIVFGVITYIS